MMSSWDVMTAQNIKVAQFVICTERMEVDTHQIQFGIAMVHMETNTLLVARGTGILQLKMCPFS